MSIHFLRQEEYCRDRAPVYLYEVGLGFKFRLRILRKIFIYVNSYIFVIFCIQKKYMNDPLAGKIVKE